jgi:Na+/H+ antiporter NhaA
MGTVSTQVLIIAIFIALFVGSNLGVVLMCLLHVIERDVTDHANDTDSADPRGPAPTQEQ